MAYSKSYLFLGLNLFVFLSFEVLADIHVPPMLTVEPNLPSMADQLNDKQISKIKAYFSLIDKDGDVSIDNEELDTLIRSTGLNPTDFGLMVARSKSATDGNGTIDFTKEELLIVFSKPDTDHNGFVTASELHCYFTNQGIKMTIEEANEYVRAADSDGDGHLSFKEFVRLGRFTVE
ncbi:putative EF-hand domain pair protein [Medicago truncatula]|uniref:Calmodulin-like protein 2 n=1 Tax=Medicago truncatula TaxID=3880 RepID=Q8LKW7_MEDTR|nr:calmodulin [Medicago truncatula]AAM81196.1 calmodulin-like protein 2 [Medicago truncatula]AAT06577.1 calmodulin-like protein 2 [Medicago truncatula]AFK41912.1 unknown [Medicago truncatula]KEH33959.1 EF-hand pair protein [Medicago truncatula]RHN67237.1 putative EF-hand domain pair protein [Medicago truncatula]